MREFKELELEKCNSPELTVTGSEVSNQETFSTPKPGQDNGDSSKSTSRANNAKADSTNSDASGTTECDANGRAESGTEGPTGHANSNDSLITPASSATPRATVPSSTSDDIAAARDIRDRMDTAKQQKYAGINAVLKPGSSPILSLAKPLFVLAFLMLLPWVLLSNSGDWSGLQILRFNQLGEQALSDGNLASAQTYYLSALAALESPQVRPRRVAESKAYSFARLGDVAYLQHNLPLAESQYNRAVQFAPYPGERSSYLSSLATVQTQRGNYREAEQNVLKASLINSNSTLAPGNDSIIYARQLLAYVYLKEGKYQKAIAAANSAKALDHDGWAYVANTIIGDAYRAMNKNSEAIDAYTSGSQAIEDENKFLSSIASPMALQKWRHGYSTSDLEYYLYALRCRAFAYSLQGNSSRAAKFIDAAASLSKLINLSGDSDLPPIYSVRDIQSDRNLIERGSK